MTREAEPTPRDAAVRRSSFRGRLAAGLPQHVHRPVEVKALAAPRGRRRVDADLDARRCQALVRGLQRRPRSCRRRRRLLDRAAVRMRETRGPGRVHRDEEPLLVHRPMVTAAQQHQVVERGPAAVGPVLVLGERTVEASAVGGDFARSRQEQWQVVWASDSITRNRGFVSNVVKYGQRSRFFLAAFTSKAGSPSMIMVRGAFFATSAETVGHEDPWIFIWMRPIAPAVGVLMVTDKGHTVWPWQSDLPSRGGRS